MQVGDLVTYVEDEEVAGRTLPAVKAERGIIVGTEAPTMAGIPNRSLQWEVVWFTCDNRGWWDEKRLEVISASR